MSKVKKIATYMMLLFFSISLQAQGDMHLFSVPNKSGAVTPKKIEQVLNKSGFVVDLNSEMNSKFLKQFKKTKFKVFTLMTFHHAKYASELITKYPQSGILTPMGLGIYQDKDEDTLHVSILSAQAQAKILGIKETKILKSIEKDLLKALKKALPNAKMHESKESAHESHELMTTYELDLDGEDADDAKDELTMNLEGAFQPFGFVIAGTQDVTFLDEDKIAEMYDFYDTYSICKLKVIYTVALTNPDASAFAPCTTMLYKKKSEDKIVIGFPSVYNWISSVNIVSKEAKEVLLKAEHDFESILKDVTE